MNCAPIKVQCKLEIPSCDIPHFLSKLSILHTLDWLIFHKSWQMSKVLADCHSLVECHLFRLNSKIMIFEECPNLYFSWFIGGDGFKPTQKKWTTQRSLFLWLMIGGAILLSASKIFACIKVKHVKEKTPCEVQLCIKNPHHEMFRIFPEIFQNCLDHKKE